MEGGAAHPDSSIGADTSSCVAGVFVEAARRMRSSAFTQHRWAIDALHIRQAYGIQ